MDVKQLLGGKTVRTIVDFASIVLTGIILTRVLQIVWSLANTNFILGALPWMVSAILTGFLGGYVVKIYCPGWYWWEAISSIGTVIIGFIIMVASFNQSTYILLLNVLLGLYFWNIACCDVHMRDTMMSQQDASGTSFLLEIIMALLVSAGVFLPFIVDPYIEFYVIIVDLVVLACICPLMIASAKSSKLVPANAGSAGLAGISVRVRAKAFLDGKNIVRAVLLVMYLLVLEYFSFEAIQARGWWYSTPGLGFLYDIELYSITYYSIIAGAIIAFFLLQLVFEQGKYKMVSIETAVAITFLCPVAFLLFLAIGNSSNFAILFIFSIAAFFGMVFAFFIALLGYGVQVHNIFQKQKR